MLCLFRPAPAIAVVAALLSAGTSFADPVLGGCSPTKVRFIASDFAFFTTTSTTFVNVPQTALNFTQGGTKPSCVIFSVSADPFSAPQTPGNPAPLTVRAVLDGVTPALPNEVDFSDGGDHGNQARSFDFIFPTVSPGTHSVRLQFKTVAGALPGDFNRHNIAVYYAP